MAMATKDTKKEFSNALNKHLKKWEEKSNQLFDSFHKDIQSKGLKTKKEEDNLWNQKYKSRFMKNRTQAHKEYAVIHNKYFNKK